MSLASVAAQQTSAATAANAAANAALVANASTSASATSGASATSANALTSLSSNFNDFLNLLMTQLQNQDPTSPMDTTQFTTELVQFANVQQQITTNSSLTQLIQLTQGNEMLQSSAIVGKQVDVQTSNQLPLQNGTANVQFSAAQAEPVAIAVYNSAGVQVLSTTVQANAGTNAWTWNGQSNAGSTVPDGTYTAALEGAPAAGGTPVALPFTVLGTVTGVQAQNNAVQVQLGNYTTSIGNVQQVIGN